MADRQNVNAWEANDDDINYHFCRCTLFLSVRGHSRHERNARIIKKSFKLNYHYSMFTYKFFFKGHTVSSRNSHLYFSLLLSKAFSTVVDVVVVSVTTIKVDTVADNHLQTSQTDLIFLYYFSPSPQVKLKEAVKRLKTSNKTYSMHA